MASVDQNFSLFIGEAKVLSVSVDTAGDLTAARSITWCLAKTPNSTRLLSKALGSGVAAVSTKLFEVIIDPSDTTSIAPGDYYHEARVVDDSGNPSVVTVGSAAIYPSLTR